MLSRFSCLSLVAGLVIGVVALWASAAPILGTGDSIIAGWYMRTSVEGDPIGVTSNSYDTGHCAMTLSDSCAAAREWNGTFANCVGSTLTIGSPSARDEDPWFHSASPASGCSAGLLGTWWCDELYNVSCY